MGGSQEASIQENLGQTLHQQAVFQGLLWGSANGYQSVVAEQDGHAIIESSEGLFRQLFRAGEAVFRHRNGAANLDDNLIYEGGYFPTGNSGNGGIDGVGVNYAAHVGPAAIDAQVQRRFGGGGEFFLHGLAVDVD